MPSSHSVQNLFSSLFLCRNTTVKCRIIILLVVLCGRETWSAILTEKKNKLTVIERRELRKKLRFKLK